MKKAMPQIKDDMVAWYGESPMKGSARRRELRKWLRHRVKQASRLWEEHKRLFGGGKEAGENPEDHGHPCEIEEWEIDGLAHKRHAIKCRRELFLIGHALTDILVGEVAQGFERGMRRERKERIARLFEQIGAMYIEEGKPL